jgi:hypothetical protein
VAAKSGQSCPKPATTLLYDVESETIKELPPYAFGRRWWKTVEWPKMPPLIRDDPRSLEINGTVIVHHEFHAQDDVSVYVEDGRTHFKHAAILRALEWLVL